MANTVWKVRLAGKILFFMDENQAVADAPLCSTVTDRVEGRVSYAHALPDGTVMRYRKVIGQRADLEFLERVEEPDASVADMLTGLANMRGLQWAGPGPWGCD